MLRIVSSFRKYSQSFFDEIQDVDWGDDDDDSQIGSINESNYEDVLVDDVEDPESIQEGTPGPQPTHHISLPGDWLDEIPRGNELLGIPEGTKEVEYDQPTQLVYDGIDHAEVISFDYTNRHGMYAGWRTVEPHYTFMARTTGNEVLVTFDRDVGDIRAFIVGNIHPYGVRYKSVEFQPRDEIMVGVY